MAGSKRLRRQQPAGSAVGSEDDDLHDYAPPDTPGPWPESDTTNLIIQLYDGMNSSLDEILDSYSDDQIDLIAGFLRRCTQAGHSAADQLAKNPE